MVKHTFDEKAILDRNLALEAVRVTEAAALSASRLIGRGDEKTADQAAVDSMRHALNALDIEGTVVKVKVSEMKHRCCILVRM